MTNGPVGWIPEKGFIIYEFVVDGLPAIGWNME
jgi:hypothetical protein